MRIQTKFAIYFFLFSFLALTVISLAFFNHTKTSEISTARELLQLEASEEAFQLGYLLEEKAKIVQTMAHSTELQKALIASNEEFSRLSDDARNNRISELDKRWMAQADSSTSFVTSYLNNPIANLLRLHQRDKPEEIGEIFVTNRFGMVVGTTNKLTTLAHAHKYWWKGAFNNGSGRVFFDDRGFDASVGDYVIGVVVPVYKSGEVIGILKSNFTMSKAFIKYMEDVYRHSGSNIVVARAGGLIVIGRDIEPLAHRVEPEIAKAWLTKSNGTALIAANDVETLFAYAPIGITQDNGEFGFGGSPASIDHAFGNDQEGWFVVVSTKLDQLLTPTRESTNFLFESGLFVSLFMAFLAMGLGKQLAKPIEKLTAQAKKIGQGHFNVAMDVPSNDELGVLAKVLNNTAKRLRVTTVSRDNLAKEIQQRQELEKELKRLSVTDELTGVYNRRGFITVTESLLKTARRSGCRCALFFCDMDNLKTINDTFGHKVGDEAIKALADILTHTFRESDAIGRMGGDEFAVFIRSPEDQEQAIQILESRLEQNIKEFNKKRSELEFLLSVSVGAVRCVPEKPEPIDALIVRADQLMYKAKRKRKAQAKSRAIRIV